MAGAKDLYMQFKELTVALNASNSSTLEEQEVDTGLSIRGGLVWLIHLVEFWFSSDSGAASIQQKMCLSTVQEQAAFPALNAKGTIALCTYDYILSSGVGFQEGIVKPSRQSFLPPVPIAAPTLSLYGVCSVDQATLRGDELQCRIGFTTAPLDNAMYTEIAETWGW